MPRFKTRNELFQRCANGSKIYPAVGGCLLCKSILDCLGQFFWLERDRSIRS